MVCVAVRNVVRVFTCTPSSAGAVIAVKFAREHSLEGDVVGLAWAGINLCVSFVNGNYMYLDPIPGIVIQDVHVTVDGLVQGDAMDGAASEDDNDDAVIRRAMSVSALPVDSTTLRSKVTRLPVAVLHDADMVRARAKRQGGDGAFAVAH